MHPRKYTSFARSARAFGHNWRNPPAANRPSGAPSSPPPESTTQKSRKGRNRDFPQWPRWPTMRSRRVNFGTSRSWSHPSRNWGKPRLLPPQFWFWLSFNSASYQSRPDALATRFAVCRFPPTAAAGTRFPNLVQPRRRNRHLHRRVESRFPIARASGRPLVLPQGTRRRRAGHDARGSGPFTA